MKFYTRYQSSFRFASFWLVTSIAILAIVMSNNSSILSLYTLHLSENAKYNFLIPKEIWKFIINQEKLHDGKLMKNIEFHPDSLISSDRQKYGIVVDYSLSMNDIYHNLLSDSCKDNVCMSISNFLSINSNEIDSFHNSKLLTLLVGVILNRNNISNENIIPFYYCDQNENQLLRYYTNLSCYENLENWIDNILKCNITSCTESKITHFPELLNEILEKSAKNGLNNIYIFSDYKHFKNFESYTSILQKCKNLVKTYQDHKIRLFLVDINNQKFDNNGYIDFIEVIKTVLPTRTTIKEINFHEFEKELISNDITHNIDSWLLPYSHKSLQLDGKVEHVINDNIIYDYRYSVNFKVKQTSKLILTPFSTLDNVVLKSKNGDVTNNNFNQSIYYYDLLPNIEYFLSFDGKLNQLSRYNFDIVDTEKSFKTNCNVTFNPTMSKSIISIWKICLILIFLSLSYYTAISIYDFFNKLFTIKLASWLIILLVLFLFIFFCWTYLEYEKILPLVMFLLYIFIGFLLFLDDNYENRQ